MDWVHLQDFTGFLNPKIWPKAAFSFAGSAGFLNGLDDSDCDRRFHDVLSALSEQTVGQPITPSGRKTAKTKGHGSIRRCYNVVSAAVAAVSAAILMIAAAGNGPTDNRQRAT
jgi:hypothetical protein